MNNSNKEKILDVTTGKRLTFSSHTRELYKKLLKKYQLYQGYKTDLMILKKTFFTLQ